MNINLTIFGLLLAINFDLNGSQIDDILIIDFKPPLPIQLGAHPSDAQVPDVTIKGHYRVDHHTATMGLGLYDKDLDLYYGATSSHNLCAVKFLTRYNSTEILSDSFEYSYNGDCGKYYFKNQSYGKMLYKRNGFNAQTAIDFADYERWDDYQQHDEVEKIGSVTGHTIGYIDEIDLEKPARHETCDDANIRFREYITIRSKNSSMLFADSGDCGSVVYSSKLRKILGFIVGVVAENNESWSYTIVEPYHVWQKRCNIESLSHEPISAEGNDNNKDIEILWLGTALAVACCIILIMIISISCEKKIVGDTKRSVDVDLEKQQRLNSS
eukprot:CAMPEP_0201584872 /NCGR_PEP_ID=MMETSP0190_2-20130828/115921_1 /ASSEMBLY_ACC=CAM_ASM_000263 /TAXON_ID=37353 /ORGANISM="Rosalina sp." /LENGTH=326 /DNA_ID=CAMNT_0048029747 /DNA_START=56 /DNA_END=1036 /DNA_ORIENTATION=+